jgi:F-type H+-transporting ATPase subunit delta
MQAASREALASLRENQVVTDSASLSVDAVIARFDELYSVADVLAGQPQVRRAIADPAADGRARTGLVAALFAGKVSAPVLELLQAASLGRWSSPWDLVDSLELCADEMVFAVAERERALDNVEDELFRFERLLDTEGQLNTLLDEAVVPPPRRVGLLDSIIEGKVHPLTKALLDRAVASQNKRSIAPAVDTLLTMAGARRSRSVARVLAARELTAAQQRRLASALTDLYGRPITVLTAVDPSVRGGLVVRVGDEIIDGSVAARLVAVRQALAG